MKRKRTEKERVAIVGSGNWGSAISRIVAANTKLHPEIFELKVNMWVFEELVDGRKLSELINETHENKKYLPGVQLPENVIAVTDLVESVKGASMLIFVLPHQFLKKTCASIRGSIAADAKAISLIKGLEIAENGPLLLSRLLSEELKVDVSVLMGANIANEVAKEVFSEATIGYGRGSKEIATLWQTLFNINYFSVSIVEDIPGVEISGALKNIVALAAGFVDGLGYGGNTKAAVIRIGMAEMRKFCRLFYKEVKDDTFWESCGIADLIVTCYEGRNRKCAESFVKTGKSFQQLEEEILNGQKLQGTLTAEEVYGVLNKKNLLREFPLFTAVHRVATKELSPDDLIKEICSK
jgi:glycerol-3-phosphate dehydrogenase (NAD+)